MPGPRGPAQHVELELGAGDRRQLEQLPRRREQSHQALAHDLADAVGGGDLLQRPGQAQGAIVVDDRSGLDQGAPQLAEQERIAVREVADRG
jgi:hypothetical protein